MNAPAELAHLPQYLTLPPPGGEAVEALRQARERVRVLTRDGERLDEIERSRCYPFWNSTAWVFIVAQPRSSKIDSIGVGATAREAIDRAMRCDGDEAADAERCTVHGAV